MSFNHRVIGRAATLTVGAGLLLACGDDDTATGRDDGGDPDLTVIAFDSNDFDEDSYTVSAGEVTIEYENDGNIRHTLVIEDDGLDLAVNSRGDTDRGTVDLEAGEYVIYCDEPGHRSGGMEADLTVE